MFGRSYLFLLFIHVSDLEPDIFLSERPRRVVDDILEALRNVRTDDEKRW